MTTGADQILEALKVKGRFFLSDMFCCTSPVYFTDIGCEGRLRDLTTAMGQLTQRQDRLAPGSRSGVTRRLRLDGLDG